MEREKEVSLCCSFLFQGEKKRMQRKSGLGLCRVPLKKDCKEGGGGGGKSWTVQPHRGEPGKGREKRKRKTRRFWIIFPPGSHP